LLNPRVVVTHDFMETYGGAERVTQEIAAAFPDAPVYALLGRDSVAARMGVAGRFHSLLPARPGVLRHYRLAAPLYPALAAAVRLPQADAVISSSYAYAHGLRARGGAVRVCYCHSPLRFAWSMTEQYAGRVASGPGREAAFAAFAAASRVADRRLASGVERFLTQSPFVAAQIERAYGRPATVVGAPVDLDRFAPSGRPPGEHFLLAGRLVEPYKRVDVALDAFRGFAAKLLVAGDGPALEELRRAAPPNVEFLGALGDRELVEVMQSCRALVFPSRDDFGLMPVEAMACGRPVLAYGEGGAVHTVVPGLTGELWSPQTPDALRAALTAFDPARYDPDAIRAHALRWDRRAFRDRIRDEVLDAIARRAG
jgi:glycosyltransferase involved in cell wall biosynthesis